MSILEEGYNIQRPMNHCIICGADIVDQEKHPSMLDYSDNDSIRKDYCFNCWKELDNRKFFSFWIAKRIKPGPDKKTTKIERNKSFLQLFISLYHSKEKYKYRPHLFLLSHFLMKYQVFKWKETISANESERNFDIKLDIDIKDNREINSESDSEKNENITDSSSPAYSASGYIIFIHRETGDEYTVEDIPLDDENLVNIKKEIDSAFEIKEEPAKNEN